MPYRRFVFLLMLAAPSAFAQWQWPKLQVEKPAAVGEVSVTGTYAFTNVGEQPIALTQVRTSCGCTAATLDKTTYAPQRVRADRGHAGHRRPQGHAAEAHHRPLA